ncbi:esterase/lipase family protein [Noviherbaspirillum massiliense]|uniref:esterase/lipase family protein n=1 Tax=Noviherbaspirillum massiliense TaxID=1465823 RepID=UPI0002E7D339|nr:alpha/beta fold hydrolase [Noviherbaspirillum massiliense]
MITRITRILLALQLGLAFGLSAAFAKTFHMDSLMLAALSGFGLVVLLRMLITANNFLIAWIYRSSTPVGHRIKWHQTCRMFFEEFGATMLSSSWTMPFHAFKNHVSAFPAGLPVLLIHGYGCNSGYWHSMSKALVHAHITHHAVNMEPVFAGIDEFVPAVHRAIELLCQQTGKDKIIIVAHSMGGLAARAYLRAHGSARIARVITLGTPHQGTGLANFGKGLNCEQMRWTGNAVEGMSSAWLRDLAASESGAVRRLFTSIYSHQDNIIAPQTSSHLEDARNIEFHGIGHVALALNPAIQKCVIEEVMKASSAHPVFRSLSAGEMRHG